MWFWLGLIGFDLGLVGALRARGPAGCGGVGAREVGCLCGCEMGKNAAPDVNYRSFLPHLSV